MKKVVMVYEVEFEDHISDEDCYSAAIEIMRQDRHWPNDDQMAITVDQDTNDPKNHP